MPSVIYREAERSDIPSIARIREAVWGTGKYWVNRISGYLDGTHNPQQALPQRIIYVAQQSDSLVGFIAGHLTQRYNCEGEIEWINVISESRGSGAASELFLHLARWFVEQKALRVCVNCAPDNIVALHFYTRLGATSLNEHWLVWNDISTVLSANILKEQA
jgi:ribosomal protein S18 acetylase RimI-like enzyme